MSNIVSVFNSRMNVTFRVLYFSCYRLQTSLSMTINVEQNDLGMPEFEQVKERLTGVAESQKI